MSEGPALRGPPGDASPQSPAPSPARRVVGVLLAAGAGARFGGDKLLAPLPDGTPVGVAAARALRDGVDRSVAVVRPGDAALATLLSGEGLEVLACPEAAQGMGTSLAFGVSSAPEALGWVVALADMPFLRARTVGEVAARLREGGWIVAPAYRGRRGHPVGFHRALWDELVRLRGEAGGREILERHAERVATFDTEDPGVLHDIDDPGDIPSPPGG